MTPFSDLADYAALPGLVSLRLAPDGCWLAAAVKTLGRDQKKYVTSIWRIGTGPGAPPPARLTRSAAGETGHAFLPDGSLLFVSGQPEPAGPEPGEDPPADQAALWLLPAAGGEAARLAAPPGGVTAVAAARAAPVLVFAAPVFPGTAGAEEDARRRKARADAGVGAILHDAGGMIRYWDHDLGPDCLRLLAASPPEPAAAAAAGDGPGPPPRDLTGDQGRALDEQSFDLSADGSVLAAGWLVPAGGGSTRTEVAVIDVATGTRRTLLAAPDADFSAPLIAPDASLVAALRTGHDTYQQAGDVTLVATALPAGPDGTDGTGGPPPAPRDLLPGFDRRPAEAAWAPDSAALFFTADDQGRRPVFRVEVGTGKVTRVTSDDAAYASLSPAPDGRALYALRAAIDSPPAPVRIGLSGPGAPEPLPSPAGRLSVPGRVTEVHAAAADGAPLRGWLVLPDGASAQAPAPLLLWVHGGPLSSWNDWSWRWNPWLMAARGYAVLLPDPALSTGYGRDFIARGYGRWGAAPYTDVLAITDAAQGRPDIDAGRTAMMGGSFGGYMANWIAGHTGRFAAIVSHAGLWSLDQMFATTDAPPLWRREFGDPAARPGRYRDNTPDAHAARITTPMLIIHGDKDYRVPVGEAIRLYWDLTERGKSARFLYFPDENHWILKPGDVRVWYETVLAFLAEHVLGEPWRRPGLL